MKSVMKTVALIVFALFGLAVFALTMSFSFSALQRVYPGSLPNQLMGLALFDIGAVVWLAVFVWKAQGSHQRAGAFVCFGLDFVGTLILVTVEVLLGGQEYVKVQDWVGQVLIYVFIGAAVFNLVGVYWHHLTEPSVQAEIENQSLADDVEAEARRQAGEANKRDLAQLAGQLSTRISNDVRVRLGLPTLAESLFGAPVAEETKGDAGQPAETFRPAPPAA